MKKCNICAKELDDNAMFCTNCGCSDLSTVEQPNRFSGAQPNQFSGAQPNQFSSAQPNQFSSAQSNQFSGAQPNQFNGAQPNPMGAPTVPYPAQEPLAPPKKSKKGLIIGLSIGGGVLLLILIILLVVGSIVNKKVQEPDYNSYTTSESEEADSYTRGSLSDNTYTNEWMNVKVDFEEDWQNAEDEKYQSYEDAYTDCLFYIVNEKKDAMVITATNAAGTVYANYSCDEYMEYVTNSLKQTLNIVNQTETSSFFLEDREYRTQTLVVEISGGYVYYMHTAAKIGDRFVTIITISDSEQSCENILRMVQNAD